MRGRAVRAGEGVRSGRDGLRRLKQRSRLLLVPLAVLFACGAASEEDRVHRFVGRIVDAAEKRDLEGVLDHLAPEYSDHEGRDKEGARALLAGYLRNRRGIVVRLLATRPEGRDSEGRLRVRAEMMVSSGAAEALRRLVAVTGEYFRFEFVLEETKNGGWLVRFASWQHLPSSELLPESLEILRKLFSGK
jgi:hypothetical protein